MSEKQMIGEAALHAFVDKELDREANYQVEEWLQQNPEQLHDIATWKYQNEKLKEAFDPVLDEMIPKGIQETLNKAPKPPKQSSFTGMKMAASIIILIVGLVTGWYVGQPKATKKWPAFAQNAISSHLVFAGDVSRPVEYAAPQKNYFLAWVKHRMEREVTPPTLTFAGFKFLGGRVLPHEDKPAVLFMYENVHGKRITLLVGQNKRFQNKPVSVWSKGKLHCYFWFNGRLSFSVTSEINKKDLKDVTDKVYAHFADV